MFSNLHIISRNKVDRSVTSGCLQCHHCLWQCIPLLISQKTNKKQHCPQGQYKEKATYDRGAVGGHSNLEDILEPAISGSMP